MTLYLIQRYHIITQFCSKLDKSVHVNVIETSCAQMSCHNQFCIEYTTYYCIAFYLIIVVDIAT